MKPRASASLSVASTSTSSLRVTEIYASIQGESTYAGWPCVFVRLTGCPLRCVWCDTTYAFAGGERMEIDQILKRVADFGTPMVEVTGGEPLAQPECLELLERLCEAGYTTLLETSGAIDLAGVDRRVVKIMDLKCPGSGQGDANHWENLDRLTPHDQIKFVILDRTDYEWTREVIDRRGLTGRFALLLSPVHGKLAPALLARWMLEDGLRARLQIQLHKYLWPDQTRGV